MYFFHFYFIWLEIHVSKGVDPDQMRLIWVYTFYLGPNKYAKLMCVKTVEIHKYHIKIIS